MSRRPTQATNDFGVGTLGIFAFDRRAALLTALLILVAYKSGLCFQLWRLVN